MPSHVRRVQDCKSFVDLSESTDELPVLIAPPKPGVLCWVSPEFWAQLEYFPVRGSLKRAIPFWRSIGASDFVIDILESGYRLPFFHAPPNLIFPNNQSALRHSDFVPGAILALIKNRCVEICSRVPKIVNPLSVSIQSNGKKRLILDASYPNKFLLKQKFKLDDYKVALEYLSDANWVFTFDLKSFYHHFEVHPDFVDYLGFSWNFDGVIRYFRFVVCPFGVSTIPWLVTKCLKPLVAYWRSVGVHIALYLDDGLGTAVDNDQALLASSRVRSDLRQAGLIVNEAKSQWAPVQEAIWLGFVINVGDRCLRIPPAKVDRVLTHIRQLLHAPFTTPREIATVAGQIQCLSLVVGNIAKIRSKDLYANKDAALGVSNNWDRRCQLSTPARRQLVFWLDFLASPKHRPLRQSGPPEVVIFSDASDVAGAAFVEGTDLEAHLNWTALERRTSSTWRELRAIDFSLAAFRDYLQNKTVSWKTDNQAVTYIVEKGSMKPALNGLAESIMQLCSDSQIRLSVSWIRRTENQIADLLSREIDFDDWSVSDDLFRDMQTRFGPHSVDRFADARNRRLHRFNSKYSEVGSEATDAFSQNWVRENNWLVPPPALLLKTVNHLRRCQSVGTLVMPKWYSNPVWPVLFPPESLPPFVKSVLEFAPGNQFIKPGTQPVSIFTSGQLKNPLLVVRLDASQC